MQEKILDGLALKRDQYKILNEDSSVARISKVNGVATEPELGKLQKNNPSKEEANKIKNNFEELIIKTLKNLKSYVNGKIVFTAPLIFTGRGQISCDFKKISSATKLKIVEGPINEFRKDSIIGRSIIVLER